MPVPFPDLDPYKTLGVSNDATEQDIKKSYRKLCLLHHPDKLQGKTEEEQDASKTLFEKVQFAHMILSDAKKKKRYDQTESLEDVADSEFDWFEYFSQVKAEITEDSIAKDKKDYVRSSDEEEDIIESWIESKGDFLKLFLTIPHIEINEEDEKRLFEKVGQLIEDGVIKSTRQWKTYQKKRKPMFRKLLKSQKDESKEAEELKKEVVGKRKMDSEDDLRQLIQAKGKQSMDDLISRLESKYTKKGKKAKKDPYDIDDGEFERARAKVLKPKK
jgi:DnaJ family protein C protein 9